MSERLPVPARILESRVIAILRSARAEHVLAACRVLSDTGITAIEVTTNTPGWADIVRTLAREPSLEIGVGTVLTSEHAEEAVACGASYLVAPDVDERVGRAALELGVAWLPGALSPTEIRLAWEMGASAVKVFPAASAGGSSYLRQVRAPLDHIPLIPTGGISIEAIPQYLDAGAIAVGIGSPLVGDALATGDLAALANRAARVTGAASHA